MAADTRAVMDKAFKLAQKQLGRRKSIRHEVSAELVRARRKHPHWPADPLHALAILGEEYGELTQAVLQHTYEPEESDLQHVREEAVQTAAMALRFLESLDEYAFQPCKQIGRGDS